MTEPEPDYRTIVRHYEDCLERHGDNHRGVDWPNAEDAERRYGVMLDVIHRPVNGRVDLLDFGCGTGALYEHIRGRRLGDIAYTGLDLSPRFSDVARAKYPDVDFICLDVLERPDALPEFDYVVMNGVFHERLELSYERMFEFLAEVLRVVFARARIGVAFSLMTKHVDWERDELFHVPYDELASFLTRDLSRHFVFRADYGLREYTTYVYRDDPAVQRQ